MTLETLLAALLVVESGGKPNPPDGDGGRSIGPYQIQRAYWLDAVGKQYAKEYPMNYLHCRNRSYAKDVVRQYFRRYCPKQYARAFDGTATLKDFEVLARVHNGGPRGHTKKATLGYWNKVQAEIRRYKRGSGL